MQPERRANGWSERGKTFAQKLQNFAVAIQNVKIQYYSIFQHIFVFDKESLSEFHDFKQKKWS